jgi:hypothetical protein
MEAVNLLTLGISKGLFLITDSLKIQFNKQLLSFLKSNPNLVAPVIMERSLELWINEGPLTSKQQQ